MSNKRKEYFDRNYALECEVLNNKEDQKYLRDEFLYHKDTNPEGLSKEELGKIGKASKAKAASDNLKEKSAELLEIDGIITELE